MAERSRDAKDEEVKVKPWGGVASVLKHLKTNRKRWSRQLMEWAASYEQVVRKQGWSCAEVVRFRRTDEGRSSLHLTCCHGASKVHAGHPRCTDHLQRFFWETSLEELLEARASNIHLPQGEKMRVVGTSGF